MKNDDFPASHVSFRWGGNYPVEMHVPFLVFLSSFPGSSCSTSLAKEKLTGEATNGKGVFLLGERARWISRKTMGSSICCCRFCWGFYGYTDRQNELNLVARGSWAWDQVPKQFLYLNSRELKCQTRNAYGFSRLDMKVPFHQRTSKHVFPWKLLFAYCWNMHVLEHNFTKPQWTVHAIGFGLTKAFVSSYGPNVQWPKPWLFAVYRGL